MREFPMAELLQAEETVRAEEIVMRVPLVTGDPMDALPMVKAEQPDLV